MEPHDSANENHPCRNVPAGVNRGGRGVGRSAAHPQAAAGSDGDVFDESQRRLEAEFVGSAGLVVPRHQPAAGAHRSLADSQFARLVVLRLPDQIPDLPLGVAETCEDAVFGVVGHREGLAFGQFDVVQQRSVVGRQARIPRRVDVCSVAIGLVLRGAAAAQRRRFVVGREVRTLLKVPAFALGVGHDELLGQRRLSVDQIGARLFDGDAESGVGPFRSFFDVDLFHIRAGGRHGWMVYTVVPAGNPALLALRRPRDAGSAAGMFPKRVFRRESVGIGVGNVPAIY